MLQRRESMAEVRDSFERLISVPGTISEEMFRFDDSRRRAVEDYSNEQQTIQDEFQSQEATSAEVRKRQKDEADQRFQSWVKKIESYVNSSRAARNRVSAILGKTFDTKGTPVSPSAALGMLEQENQARKLRRRRNDNKPIEKLCQSEMDISTSVISLSKELRGEVSAQRDREKAAADSQYSSEHESHVRKRDCELSRSTRRFEVRMEREEETFVERIEGILLPDKVWEEYTAMQKMQPNYEIFEPAEDFPEGIQFGYMGYDITGHLSDPLKNAVLSNRFAFAIRNANGRTYLTVPYGHAFTSNKFSTLFEFDRENREQAAESLRNLALNLYMSVPVNRCWCTFIDPVKLGDTFSVFSPMGDRDESGKGDERVIDTRIWSTERDIEERLKLIVDHTTDVIQRCLQGRYDNIIEYNADAGINAEPLRFLVIMDFPLNFSQQALNYLGSIIDNGPKTGVYTIIAADKQEMANAGRGISFERLRSRIKNNITSKDGILCVEDRTREGQMRYFPFSGPTPRQGQEIIDEIRKHLGEKIIVTYPMISGNISEKPEYWFHKSALDGISVPIGMEGAGKIANLEFGHPYRSLHAMVGGTIGYGKTNTLHAIIQGVLFNYSPEDVQIYLLDFKEGVELKRYADYKLANFKVISVETEPEFGLAVLMELHKEIGRRSGKFKSYGVSHIEEYWRLKGARGESHADMPRILIVFDEVQRLLDDEENGISKACASLIREVVTQGGNAFGMHLIMSTQTFENVKGLGNGVYSNIATRIVHHASKGSADIMLDNDNDIMQRLASVDAGQAIINTNSGDKDANRMIRVALIDRKEQDKWMEMIHDKQLETMESIQKPRILLPGPEDDSDNPLTVFANSGQRPSETGDPQYHLYIGESLTMINTFLPTLRSRAGQNILLAGRDSENGELSRMVIGYTALSLLYETIRLKGSISEPFITLMDLSGSSIYGMNDYDMIDQIVNYVPEAFRVIQPHMILEGIETLYSELSSGRQQFVLFYGLTRAKQLTTGTYERSPKEILEMLFAKGPENGMHFIVWANDPGLFLENYAASLRSFDCRLAYGMDDKEYRGIVGENGPKHSSPMNVISFNQIGDNQKVRMYSRPTKEWLSRFLKNVRTYLG